jgi:hypothetical protein
LLRFYEKINKTETGKQAVSRNSGSQRPTLARRLQHFAAFA